MADIGVDYEWDECLYEGIKRLMSDLRPFIAYEHTKDTPTRVVQAYKEYFSGCVPSHELTILKGFPNDGCDEMIYVNDISFVSFCAHHLVPFFGKVHFAYIPGKNIVGLSKIPRLVELYAKRPQVQEQLTVQIVDTFQRVIKPRGCGVVIEAYHMCMMIRGIKKERAYTKTTALRGLFQKNKSTKSEFLAGVPKKDGGSWL